MSTADTLRDLATRYTAAWCSQDPARVASFFSPDGSLKVNDSAPAVGRTAIADVARGFMTAFPDMQVLLDDVSGGGRNGDLSMDARRNQYRPWRDGTSRSRQRIRGVAARCGRVHRRVARPLRLGRVSAAAGRPLSQVRRQHGVERFQIRARLEQQWFAAPPARPMLAAFKASDKRQRPTVSRRPS